MTATKEAVSQAVREVTEGRGRSAIPALTLAVADAPTDPSLRIALGLALADDRQFDAAAVQFLKASRARPAAVEPR
ncbi:MAG: hypothetical protein FJX59_17800, partial [Alphaproteobacteria bacterium]|nr:hypothetical protein [Alphaproteobacteria bacterium]